MLVLYFVTDQGSHFVMGAVLVFGSLFQRRCGVILASCCGSGNTILPRRFGVPVASCCWQRQSCDVAASQCVCSCGSDKLYRRSRLWEARSWVSSLVGERNWPSWCLLGPAGFSSIVSSALRVTGGAMVDDDCNEACAVQTEIVLRCSARDSRFVCGQGG